MGEIIAEVELENAVDLELVKTGHLAESNVWRITVRTVVDRGAMMLTLPKNLLRLPPD